jgi:hypothetical protein
MSDPRLKAAMTEIKDIAEKHDIAGYFVLVSPTHSEFQFAMSPSWSCIHEEKDGSIRFRAKSSEFESPDVQRETMGHSLHIICQIRDICAQVFAGLDKMLNSLGKQIDFYHTPYSGFEPHNDK